MANRGGKSGDFSSVAAALSGTTATAALRRVRSFADAAPSGRLFDAIATLTEMSSNIEAKLEAGSEAMGRGEDNEAALYFTRAAVRMDEMAATATPARQSPGKLPDYLKKRR